MRLSTACILSGVVGVLLLPAVEEPVMRAAFVVSFTFCFVGGAICAAIENTKVDIVINNNREGK